MNNKLPFNTQVIRKTIAQITENEQLLATLDKEQVEELKKFGDWVKQDGLDNVIDGLAPASSLFDYCNWD